MRWSAVGAVTLFWVGSLVAGALTPGYSVRADYVSSLAGRGSSVAVLGIAAIAVLGCAHLFAARGVGGAPAAPLAAAGVAGLVIAAVRTHCPGGAAGCGFTDHPPPVDLAQTGHSWAVAAYEIALVVAMLVAAARPGPRWFRVLTVLAAVASVVLLLRTGGADNGAWQRSWLVVNTGWLVLLVLSSRALLGRGCPVDRVRAR